MVLAKFAIQIFSLFLPYCRLRLLLALGLVDAVVLEIVGVGVVQGEGPAPWIVVGVRIGVQ